MRILIVEDNTEEINRAETALSRHELTIVSTFKEGVERLGGFRHYMPEDREGNRLTAGEYDLAVFDLHFPIGELHLFHDETLSLRHQPEPLGWILALLAMRVGVPRVLLWTTANHHSHVLGAGMDYLENAWGPWEDTTLLHKTTFRSRGSKSWEYLLGEFKDQS